MADPRGFLEVERVAPPERDPRTRTRDHHEIFLTLPADELREQGRRCMDCGIPFCHQGCPLGNLIPEWNDLVRRGEWRLALDRLHETNNFPEFTGLICPAPCEAACVLAINDDPVMIKAIEWGIIERGFAEGWVGPKLPRRATALVRRRGRLRPGGARRRRGAQRAGHRVVVYERDEGPGGLIRLGVPDFKLEKWIIDRRVALLEQAGIVFEYGVDVGTDLASTSCAPPRRGRARAPARAIEREIDAARPRARRHPHRDGVPAAAQPRRRRQPPPRTRHRARQARGRDRRRRHGGRLRGLARTASAAKSVTQLDIYPPPAGRSTASSPPGRTSRSASGRPTRSTRAARASSSFNATAFTAATATSRALIGDHVGAPPDFEPTGETLELPADLVLIAIGFTGAERGLPEALGVDVDDAADRHRRLRAPPTACSPPATPAAASR